MYVTLTDLQNGEPVYLTRPLSGGLGVALCELTYYHQFYNISAAIKNNQIRNGPTTIPDGYYNVCELDKFFQLLNTELTLHTPTGRLQLSTVKRLNLPVILNSGLAKLVGFSQEIFQPGKEYTADKPHRLAVYRGICVHLAEVSSSDNLHNGHPSTLLRSVPVEYEKCGSGWTETFHVLQYKRLSSGPVTQLTISLRDTKGKMLPFEYINATLHIRNG